MLTQIFLLMSIASGAIVTSNGQTFGVTYSNTTQLLTIKAGVKPDSWLGVGFGEGMGSETEPTDMILFQAKDRGIVKSLQGIGHQKPRDNEE